MLVPFGANVHLFKEASNISKQDLKHNNKFSMDCKELKYSQ